MATITINQGQLKGSQSITDNGISYYEFLCVPYAQPPVGELRFKSPQPANKWHGVRDATMVNEELISLQLDPIKGIASGSEDCLYLNVFTPRLPEENSKLLPVMVFIHGGGFVCSNGIIKSELGPDYLIENNVIVVTINYRLGVFGFLSLDIPEVAGNMGLKDQVSALKWVQNNIKYFGGDNNNVTIFGISAGSASVEYLILSPLGKGLFHKAILQSGSCLNHWAFNHQSKKMTENLLNELNYKGSLSDVRAMYEYLLNAPASELIKSSHKAGENLNADRLVCGFVPTVEKDFDNGDALITDHPYKILNEGKYNNVPVIKGFCDKEGYLTLVMKPNTIEKMLTKKNFVSHLPYVIKDGYSEQLNSLFNAAYSKNESHVNEPDRIAVDFFGDFDFVSGIWLGGKIMASHGNPVYFYNLCYDGNMNFLKNMFGLKKPGCAHGDDIAYIFRHTLSNLAQDRDVNVRTNMTNIWTNFAKTGKPTPDYQGTLEWPSYSESSPCYLKIDDEFNIIASEYEPKKIEIFKEIYETYGQ